MSVTCCQDLLLKTPRKKEKVLEEVLIEGPIKSVDLEKLHMNQKLINFRPPEKQKEALIAISKLPEGMVYLARNGKEIVGYVTFHYPDKYIRWSKHPKILELGAIEVSPDWRLLGIGVALLKEAFSNPVMEDYIVVTVEFYWHWDLKGSKMEVFDYQRMLAKFFGTVGFKKRATDDPDITEYPANVLMVRVGKNIQKNDIILFENMLFENKPSTPKEKSYARAAGLNELLI